MTRYVLGYAFDRSGRFVVLIKKNRPEWQAGRLNGIGGKIERYEKPLQAMVREFYEETGVETDADGWYQYLSYLSPSEDSKKAYKIYVFFTYLEDVALAAVQSMTDEEVSINRVSVLGEDLQSIEPGIDPLLPNVNWMIQMALSFNRGEKAAGFFLEEEN